jgi:hypothetical protein
VKFQRDWSEFLEIFGRHGVRFLLVGAHALAAHGRVRATLDLDVFIDATPANARKVGEALAEFGFANYRESWELFTTPYNVTMLGQVPNRIDILTRISGVTFSSAWRNRCEVKADHGTIAVIGLRDLIKNKRASGRNKDRSDLSLLAEAAAVPAEARPRTSTRAASRSRSKRRPPKARPSRKPGKRRPKSR